MSEMSNYLENALVNAVFRNTSYTSPVTVYVALHTADPAEDASGTEVSTGGYARQACAFDAPSDGVTQNTALESFTASGASWGSVTHFAIWDASTVGNMLVYSALDTSRTVNDGDTLEFAAGAISITFA